MAVSYKVSLAMFGKELERQSTSYKNAIITGMRKTAVFGKTAVVRTIKRTKDPFRIRASGTYEAAGNWVTQDTNDGAVLAPISKHALFVERGRKKGKMPPEQVIREWAFQKRIFKSRVSKANLRGQDLDRCRAIDSNIVSAWKRSSCYERNGCDICPL